jgi:hypothetical protein
MPDKKLTNENLQIRRGAGVQFSTDAPSQDRKPAKPPKDTNWVSKGAEWRPAQHHALKVLAAQRRMDFREVLEEAITAYLAAQETNNGK